MKNVTYRGPEDPLDGTTVFVVEHDEKIHRFPKDVPVEVNEEVAGIIDEQEGQGFDVDHADGHASKSSPPAGAGEKRDPSKQADQAGQDGS